MKAKGNIELQLASLNEYFFPKVIAEVDNVYVKLAKIKGDEIPWHNHRNEDEMFIILRGELLFEVENRPSFRMSKGDFFVVKKGINHRVSARDECQVMLIENKSTAHTGDVNSTVTKSIDQQLEQ